MHLTASRAGGDIVFTAKIVGAGATADFVLLTDNYKQLTPVKIDACTASFTVAAVDLQNTTTWPAASRPALCTELPTWNSGTPVIYLTAKQAGALLPNSEMVGSDPAVLATIATKNGLDTTTVFELDLT